jgi:hypothetical protein
MTEEFIAEELTALWEEYRGKFTNPVLNEVLERGFGFAIPEKCEVLITGINQSYQSKKPDALLRYTYQEVKHSYFTTLRKIVPSQIDGAEVSVSYLDLFYFRNTEQTLLREYHKEHLGISFLSQQLKLTKKIIEWISPKVILIMNKGSWVFWEHNNKYAWMGYQFKLVNDALNFGKLYEITGLESSGSDESSVLHQSSLIGTIVYLSRHLNRLSNDKLVLIKMEVTTTLMNLRS